MSEEEKQKLKENIERCKIEEADRNNPKNIIMTMLKERNKTGTTCKYIEEQTLIEKATILKILERMQELSEA